MRPYTKVRIEPLIQKYQRNLTLEDVEAIVELDAIACEIEKNAKAIAKKTYFEIDGRFFNYPSFRALEFIEKAESKYFTGHFKTLASLWALDCERKPDDFTKMPSTALLLLYGRSFDSSVKEIIAKINEEFGKEDGGEQKEDERVDHWYICAILAREVGGSPEEWYNAPQPKIDSAIKAVDEKIEAEMRSVKKNGPPKVTPTLIAVSNFRKKQNELEAKWAAE